MSETVDIERRADVALLRLCRPESRNAMDAHLLQSLASATRTVSNDDAVRAVVLTGDDRAFSVGGDVAWMASHDEGAAEAVRLLAGWLHQTVLALRRTPKPVIAAVRGVAAGAGMSLALACDFRILGKSARFVLAYPSRGLSFDGGASFSLPRLVGVARTLEILGFDEPISADRAIALGLATKVANDESVVDDSLELAARLASGSVHAFGRAKSLLLDTFETPLERQLERERETLADCAAHPDGAEGIASFVEKRDPVFRRR